ncbi:MAG: hypothetical protein JWP57_4308, partial [Spirosoma sp.]|nr:hypothetical protein [Spirosoma sp.]
VGPPQLVEVVMWFKAAGYPNTFLTTSNFLEPADLDCHDIVGINPHRNPTACQQVLALRTYVRYHLSRSLLFCIDVTPALVRQVVSQWRKRPGYVLNVDPFYDQLESVLRNRPLSRNERTALIRRLYELDVSLTDGFVEKRLSGGITINS